MFEERSKRKRRKGDEDETLRTLLLQRKMGGEGVRGVKHMRGNNKDAQRSTENVGTNHVTDPGTFVRENTKLEVVNCVKCKRMIK